MRCEPTPTDRPRLESKTRSPNPQRPITPHYRVSERDSSRVGMGYERSLAVDSRPTGTKSRRKVLEARHFPRAECLYRVRPSAALARGNLEPRLRRESNRPAGDIESISRDFGAAREANPRRELPWRSRATVRMRNAPASPKWPRRNLNLPLAAGPRVRHIRARGAVAEWLKAAVC